MTDWLERHKSETPNRTLRITETLIITVQYQLARDLVSPSWQKIWEIAKTLGIAVYL